MTEWFSSKIARLSELNEIEEKKEIITEMKIKLQSTTSRDLDEISAGIDLAGLFSQLTSNDREFIEETCGVLQTLLDSLDPGEVHRRYPTQLHKFISHKESPVRSLILREIGKLAESPEKYSQLLKDLNILNATVESIGDNDLKVATMAMDVIKRIGKFPEAAKILYSGALLRSIARLLSKNDTVSFRVYEVIVEIAKSSKEGLEATADSGFLRSLINVLDHDDILLQLNGLEVMVNLALSEKGLDYLESQDVLRKLADRITRADENPLSGLLIPGLMKFFGGVARSRPNEIFAKYPCVVSALFEVIEASEDLALLGNALDTLGLVASSIDGKYALQSFGDSMPRALKKILTIVQTMPSELRVRGLENLALILRVEENERDNRIMSLTKSWFDALGDDPLQVLVSLCKQPFVDIQKSSLEILAVISTQFWGQEYVANCPGLVEFLLDRSVATSKICKETKYRIVRTLREADLDVFDSGTLQNLEKFIRQGAYHVDADMEVMTEGAS